MVKHTADSTEHAGSQKPGSDRPSKRAKDRAGSPQSPVDVATEESTETDLAAIANVRELLLGDAIRAIREEMLCNHSIVLNRLEALQKSTAARLTAIVNNQGKLKRHLELESGKRGKQVNALKNHFVRKDDQIRTELKQIADQTIEATRRTHSALGNQLAEQAQNLAKSELRLRNRMNSDISRLNAEKLKRTELADSLRAIAEEVTRANDSTTPNSVTNL